MRYTLENFLVVAQPPFLVNILENEHIIKQKQKLQEVKQTKKTKLIRKIQNELKGDVASK